MEGRIVAVWLPRSGGPCCLEGQRGARQNGNRTVSKP